MGGVGDGSGGMACGGLTWGGEGARKEGRGWRTGRELVGAEA